MIISVFFYTQTMSSHFIHINKFIQFGILKKVMQGVDRCSS